MWRSGLWLGSLVWVGACAAEVDTARVDDVLALEGDPEVGEAVYGDNCERCHTDGEGVGQAPYSEVVPASTDEALVTAILEGPGFMPSFDEDLSDQDIADLVAYMVATWGE